MSCINYLAPPAHDYIMGSDGVPMRHLTHPLLSTDVRLATVLGGGKSISTGDFLFFLTASGNSYTVGLSREKDLEYLCSGPGRALVRERYAPDEYLETMGEAVEDRGLRRMDWRFCDGKITELSITRFRVFLAAVVTWSRERLWRGGKETSDEAPRVSELNVKEGRLWGTY